MKRNWRYAAIAACTLIVGARAADPDQSKTYKKLETLAKVLSYVESNYIEKANVDQLIDQAIRGMLANLDPHTMYMPREVYEEMKVGTAGEYGGVGIEVGVKDDALVVVSPIENSPAQKAGVLAGDAILKLDGESTKGMSLSDAIGKIRGRNNTVLKITLGREGKPPFEVALRRQKIETTSVYAKLYEGGYGYARISNFQERSERDLRRHIGDMAKKAELKELRGLVLDLRNNPGGLLEQAVKVADLFLEQGTIVSTKGREGTFEEVRTAEKADTLPPVPMVVLVNEGSASASEIVAGALQDNKRAVIVGMTTFGKGSVQTLVDLGDGSGLKLTIAKYYTPGGHSIQARGIIPDIQVSTNPLKAEAEYTRERDLKGHILGDAEKKEREAQARRRPPTQAFGTAEDVQLTRALEYLKAGQIFRVPRTEAEPKKTPT